MNHLRERFIISNFCGIKSKIFVRTAQKNVPADFWMETCPKFEDEKAPEKLIGPNGSLSNRSLPTNLYQIEHYQ
jgi:hypothetical protein